jgi:hypothetical protein
MESETNFIKNYSETKLIQELSEIKCLISCVRCKQKVKLLDNWVDIPQSVYLEVYKAKKMSHTCCPDCFKIMYANIKL